MSKYARRRSEPVRKILWLSLISLCLAACGDSTAATPVGSLPPATSSLATSGTGPTSTSRQAASTQPNTPGTTSPTAQAVSGSVPTSASGELIVFAASSLTDPFNQLKTELEKANPGLKITYNFNSSNTLRAQLEQGARADVFASANQSEMDNAFKSNLVPDNGITFVRNRLVLILPKNNPGKIQSLSDLARPGLRFVTAQKEVPVGSYTLQALDKMSKDPAFSPDFADKVKANFVSQETNVKQVVVKVQLGEADAGIVYLSDISARVSPELMTIQIPDQFNTPAAYPLAILKGATNPAGARLFVSYLLSDKGQAILKQNNFIPVSNTTGTSR